MTTEPQLIDAQDVHVHYGESHVLRGVSLSIRAGEAVGLLGRNGMGKTTLIRTIMGHVRASRRPHRGFAAATARGCRRIALRAPASPMCRKAARSFRIFPYARTCWSRRVRERPGATNGRSSAFSRRFRVSRNASAMVASSFRAASNRCWRSAARLSTNPDVLILDEATEGLAPRVVREIWRIIGEIRATGIASLIVDRNFRTVLANTDRALILEKGRVVLEDRSEALIAQPGELAARLGV